MIQILHPPSISFIASYVGRQFTHTLSHLLIYRSVKGDLEMDKLRGDESGMAGINSAWKPLKSQRRKK